MLEKIAIDLVIRVILFFWIFMDKVIWVTSMNFILFFHENPQKKDGK